MCCAGASTIITRESNRKGALSVVVCAFCVQHLLLSLKFRPLSFFSPWFGLANATTFPCETATTTRVGGGNISAAADSAHTDSRLRWSRNGREPHWPGRRSQRRPATGRVQTAAPSLEAPHPLAAAALCGPTLTLAADRRPVRGHLFGWGRPPSGGKHQIGTPNQTGRPQPAVNRLGVLRWSLPSAQKSANTPSRAKGNVCTTSAPLPLRWSLLRPAGRPKCSPSCGSLLHSRNEFRSPNPKPAGGQNPLPLLGWLHATRRHPQPAPQQTHSESHASREKEPPTQVCEFSIEISPDRLSRGTSRRPLNGALGRDCSDCCHVLASACRSSGCSQQ